MRINQLASKKNLALAWRRITTGGNYQYKNLYRSIYLAYEVALDANLDELRQRLVGGVFEPEHPERIYVPKASGLHRPLALLNIEDQIVLTGTREPRRQANAEEARAASVQSRLQ